VCDLETSRIGAPYIYDISRLRVNSRADVESRTSYTHGSKSQRFRNYEFLKCSK
jgi:hypothetical protein